MGDRSLVGDREYEWATSSGQLVGNTQSETTVHQTKAFFLRKLFSVQPPLIGTLIALGHHEEKAASTSLRLFGGNYHQGSFWPAPGAPAATFASQQHLVTTPEETSLSQKRFSDQDSRGHQRSL